MLKTKGGKKVTKPTDLQTHKKLSQTFKDGKNETVKIGFPAIKSETNSTDSEGVTALYKATVNNYGLGVPKRPFMEVAFAQNISKYKKVIASKIGKIPQTKILDFLGSLGAGDVKKTIRDFKSPPNSDITIDIKGTDNPLIDSSHMVSAVTYSVGAK